MQFGIVIGPYVRAHRLGRVFGESGWRIERDPDTVRAPDFCFVASGHLPATPDTVGYTDLAPDLVVEVLSPWDRPRAVREKVEVATGGCPNGRSG